MGTAAGMQTLNPQFLVLGAAADDFPLEYAMTVRKGKEVLDVFRQEWAWRGCEWRSHYRLHRPWQGFGMASHD